MRRPRRKRNSSKATINRRTPESGKHQNPSWGLSTGSPVAEYSKPYAVSKIGRVSRQLPAVTPDRRGCVGDLTGHETRPQSGAVRRVRLRHNAVRGLLRKIGRWAVEKPQMAGLPDAPCRSRGTIQTCLLSWDSPESPRCANERGILANPTTPEPGLKDRARRLLIFLSSIFLSPARRR